MTRLDLSGLKPETLESIPGTEADCIEQLVALRWGCWGWRCRGCGGNVGYPVSGRPRVRVCKYCTKQTSVTAGTLLHGTRVPLRCWFLAAALLMRDEGCTSVELARRAGVHKQTAWRIMHRLRAATVSAGGFLLRGAVGRRDMTIRCRRPRSPWRDWFGFTTLADERGGALFFVSGPGDAPAIERHCPHLSKEPLPHSDEPDAPERVCALAVRDQLKHTHVWVSEKWLLRYLATRTFYANHGGQAAVRGVLHLAVSHPRRVFAEVEPALPRGSVIRAGPGRCPCASCSSEVEGEKPPSRGGWRGRPRWAA